jgi:hypothetical protein
MATAAAAVAWVAWATWACKAKPYLGHCFLIAGGTKRSPGVMPGFFYGSAKQNYLKLSGK